MIGAPRILVVRLSAIGDCLHALPLVVALREQLPDAFIGWAIESGGHRLLEGLPAVDRFHLYPRHHAPVGWRRRWRDLARFRAELRREHYGVAIDAQGLTKSGLVAWLSAAPMRVGLGVGDGRELNPLFMTRRAAASKASRHVVDRNLALLAELDLEPPGEPRWELPAYPAEQAEVDRFLGSIGLLSAAGSPLPFAVVNPGTTWETKTWPADSFARLSQLLDRELGLPVVVSWGPEQERLLAERVAAATGNLHLAPPTDLRQLAALLGRARLFVGNDTGPLHLAAALGVPSVAIFGATDPERNGPYGPAHRTVVTERLLSCRPCHSRRCRRGDLACLHWVGPEQVLEAARSLLGSQSSESGIFRARDPSK